MYPAGYIRSRRSGFRSRVGRHEPPSEQHMVLINRDDIEAARVRRAET
jgi:hypothetical protein